MSLREVSFSNLQEASRLKTTRFKEADEDGWESFVSAANNGTIFHTRRFLSYHPGERFKDNSLIFEKEGKWLALLPAIRSADDALVSHAGASMGGFIFKWTLSLKDAFRAVHALIDYAGEQQLKRIQITPPPQVYFRRPSDYFSFAMLETGFRYRKREVSSVIPLDFSEDDTLLIFSPEARRAVRRGLKLGTTVAESEEYSTFYALLQQNLKLRHDVRPTHSLDELLLLRRLFPDKIKLFAAFSDRKMVAGIVLFVCNARVALAFYISHNEEMQEYRGVNVLFYEVMRWAIREEIGYLDFGIFTVDMKPNWGLARFKESFGAQGVFRDTFVLDL